jgi:hypothetical protein
MMGKIIEFVKNDFTIDDLERDLEDGIHVYCQLIEFRSIFRVILA